MASKLEKTLFLFFILSIPSQLTFHFWPSWSFINGFPVDYLSPVLYFSDLVFIPLVLMWYFRSRKSIRLGGPIIRIFLFVCINIFLSFFPWLTLYRWLRVLQYFLLGLYLYKNHESLILNLKSLSLAVIWTSLLALLQFISKSSLGGWLYWLGERPLLLSDPSVAKISLGNFGQYLRPYATLPHPNALGGFLLVSAGLLYGLEPKSKLVNFAAMVSLVMVPFTFSRTVILLEACILLFLIIYKFRKNFLIKIFTAIFVSIILLLMLRVPHPDPSFSQRLGLVGRAGSVIIAQPLFGTGLGNSLFAMYSGSSYYLLRSVLPVQPVHNVYLYLASELGLPMAVLLIYFYYKLLLNTKNIWFKISGVIIFLSGFTDHYWLTSHQNSMLLALLISVTYSNIVLIHDEKRSQYQT